MSVKRLCLAITILLLPVLSCLGHHQQFANESATQFHNNWVPDLDEDFVGYVVNKKKRSAKESRFLKFDYLSQNINVSAVLDK